MHEAQPSFSSLLAMLALAERITEETPWLHVQGTFAHPSPFVKVKDTVHGIVVGFSSEADYTTYCQIIAPTEGQRHA